MRSWYISYLCAVCVSAWLYYYCHEEAATPPHTQHQLLRRTTQRSYITAYRDLPTSVQKRICRQAQRAEHLFFPDAQQYRFAIVRTFLSGGYQNRT